MQLIEEVIQHIFAKDVHARSANSRDVRGPKGDHWHPHVIQDNRSPPSPIPQASSSSSSLSNPVNAAGSPSPSHTVLPTEARIRAKSRLTKLKEAGLKPKKRQKVIEPGYDNCGEDMSGLGKDIVLLMHDVTREDVESSGDDFIFTTVPFVYPRFPHQCLQRSCTPLLRQAQRS